jgi:xylulokinase
MPNPQSAVHTFCHALPGAWHQMGVILSATDSLNWLCGVTGRTAAELTAGLGEALRRPSGVTFLPYLSGERTPHNDPLARGAIVGLTATTTRAEVVQALCEAIAFSLADGLEVLVGGRAPPERLALIGGGAR